MLILGVDPGTALTGYGLVHLERGRLQAVDYGVIQTDAGSPLPARLLAIYDRVYRLLTAHPVDAVAVEQLFFGRNARSALAVGHARGAVLLAAGAAGVPVEEYTPLQVKAAVVGYARADKRQMQTMVRAVLNIAQPLRPDDVADALACAITGLHTLSTAARIGQRELWS